MKRRGLCLILVFAFVCGTVQSPLSAHGIFKKTIEAKYRWDADNDGTFEKELRVTCFMCHVKGKPKTERAALGQLLHQEFKDLGLSAKWDALEGDDRKKFEEETMAPTFLKALEVVLKKENDEGVTYSELIPNGKMDGSKLREK